MKKSQSIMPWIISVLALVLSGCSQDDNSPVDIPFTEYSLAGTSCKWVDFNNGSELIVIDSEEELENYIICPEGGSIPSVDFSKHTLLLARGVEPHLNLPNNKSLQQLSPRSYVMNVNIVPGNAPAVITYWNVAIITDKLKEESNIELKITRY